MHQPTSAEISLLKTLYKAFNSRNIDDALKVMSQNVRWPKAFKGGFVEGHDDLRAYWSEQWTEIDPHVEPTAFDLQNDGTVLVTVRLLVKTLTGKVLADEVIGHRYTIHDELIVKMEICLRSDALKAAPSFDLTGKRVVVVGGKTSIGLGVATAAHAMGASVTVASRRNVSPAQRPDLAAFDQVALDLSDEESVRNAFEAMGRIDHLVVTAGPELGSWGSFMDSDMRGVRGYLETKFLGTWACARYAAPHLATDGSMTFLTGGTATKPKLGLAAVTSTFAAVESLSQSLALELAPIRVNTIRPGYIDTDFWNVLPVEDQEAIRERVRAKFPVRRLGTAADVGHAAIFLMTNTYVTGTVLDVGGGELLVDWVF